MIFIENLRQLRPAGGTEVQGPMGEGDFHALGIKGLLHPSQELPSHLPLLDGQGLDASQPGPEVPDSRFRGSDGSGASSPVLLPGEMP